MSPPTVPMADEVDDDDRPETAADEATTEAGKVTVVDDKGPKACASDVAAPGGKAGQCGHD